MKDVLKKQLLLITSFAINTIFLEIIKWVTSSFTFC